MMLNILKLLLVSLGSGVLVNAAITKSGSTVALNGIYYYVPSTAVSTLGLGSDKLKAATTAGEDLIPLTVMTGDFATFDAGTFQTNVNTFTSKDDVFNTGFLQGNYLLNITSKNKH